MTNEIVCDGPEHHPLNPTVGEFIPAPVLKVSGIIFSRRPRLRFDCLRVSCIGIVTFRNRGGTATPDWMRGLCSYCGQCYEVLDPPERNV